MTKNRFIAPTLLRHSLAGGNPWKPLSTVLNLREYAFAIFTGNGRKNSSKLKKLRNFIVIPAQAGIQECLIDRSYFRFWQELQAKAKKRPIESIEAVLKPSIGPKGRF